MTGRQGSLSEGAGGGAKGPALGLSEEGGSPLEARGAAVGSCGAAFVLSRPAAAACFMLSLSCFPLGGGGVSVRVLGMPL